MRAAITQDLLNKLPAAPCTVWDTKCPGFILRVRASGRAFYAVAYGRGKRETLGRSDTLTPVEARALAKSVLGDLAKGKDLQAERRKRKAGTLAQFLDTQYAPWAETHRKTGAQTVIRVRRRFKDAFLNRPLADITTFALESWRTQRRKAGRKDTTINRDLDGLSSVLTRAVEWGVLAVHPMQQVKRAKVDALGRLRYLSADEERRLRQTLVDRDEARRDGRRRFNAWRTARGYRPLPEIGPDVYPDHLHPITLLALNTGLRRGELLALTWADLTWPSALLAVRGATAKSGKTRHVPMNKEVLAVLRTWQRTATSPFVFPGPTGEQMASLKTAWKKIATAANLTAFTFHDLRHTFASKLVQAGVDLNTVRELLGHADIKMTLRYAHLAPEHKAAAVAKLVVNGGR
jgi:integrase